MDDEVLLAEVDHQAVQAMKLMNLLAFVKSETVVIVAMMMSVEYVMQKK